MGYMEMTLQGASSANTDYWGQTFMWSTQGGDPSDDYISSVRNGGCVIMQNGSKMAADVKWQEGQKIFLHNTDIPACMGAAKRSQARCIRRRESGVLRPRPIFLPSLFQYNRRRCRARSECTDGRTDEDPNFPISNLQFSM